jgi:hypothetical protein
MEKTSIDEEKRTRTTTTSRRRRINQPLVFLLVLPFVRRECLAFFFEILLLLASTSTVRTGGCVLATIGVVYDKGLGSANSSSLSRATVNEKKCAPAVQKDAQFDLVDPPIERLERLLPITLLLLRVACRWSAAEEKRCVVQPP